MAESMEIQSDVALSDECDSLSDETVMEALWLLLGF